ncbi:peptide chain release factor N(5)-glutamine methyltransferase [Kocuria sp. ZOR0020]|uniref:peptide chain release factor N(5)-glutamine methyltransferase n=1 Tax=Kocuria sp. ZOR0020 TaxID=1339234 RepID=UPI000ADBB3BA|nr:peptide chain release factor N(5)-glutamine methyltransferase [Kocuria sp. ZOR0020]
MTEASDQNQGSMDSAVRMTSLSQALRWATGELTAAGVETPENDAVLMAGHLMGLDRGEVQAKAIIGADVPQGFEPMVQQRTQRVPLQHLTGTAPFRGIELAVGPGVFIPRPETELLVELATQRLRADLAEGIGRPVVMDLCTGSGAIAAAVAHEVPQARIHAVELSDEALVWAQRNLAPYKRVELRQADATEVPGDLVGRVDVVVTNPPYVPDSEPPVSPEVTDHDPAMALWGGGADGMRLPVAIIRAAAQVLRPGGYMVLEHAESQADAVHQAYEGTGFTSVELHHDLTGRPRATSAVLAAREPESDGPDVNHHQHGVQQ